MAFVNFRRFLRHSFCDYFKRVLDLVHYDTLSLTVYDKRWGAVLEHSERV